MILSTLMHRESKTQSLLIREGSIVVLLVLALGLFLWAWSPALSVGFLADDYEWFVHVISLDLRESWRLFWPRTIQPVWVRYRPLVGALLWADWRIWGVDPFGYHLENLLLHGISVLGVFLLARSFWGLGGKDAPQSGVLVGILAATLFAVNPLAIEAVAWIGGRHDVLAGAAILVSLGLFLSSLTRDGSAKRWRLGLAFVLSFASLLAKEIGLVFPAYFLIIMIYKDVHRYGNTHDVRWITGFLRRRGMILVGALAVVGAYLLLSSMALGRMFWKAPGYSYGISRAFLFWFLLAVAWGSLKFLGRSLLSRRVWYGWMLIGVSLLPVAMFPTQIRFLYLPSAFTAIWSAFVVPDVLSRVGLSRLLLPAWIAVLVASASLLRLENLDWLRVSRLQRQTVASIRRQLTEVGPTIVVIFNLPDHAGRVPLFRTYVAEAVLLGFQGARVDELRIVPGPKTIDLGESSLRVIDPRRFEVESNSGFVVFDPAIRQRFPDGSVEIAGEQWLATVSPDRRQAEITLSSGLHEEGVLGLTFHLRGGILKTPRE